MLSRKTITKTEEVTGLRYCDKNCPCGENSHLMLWPAGYDWPDWLPGWMNGVSPDDVYSWLMEEAFLNSEIAIRMKTANMRVFKFYRRIEK